LAAPTAGAVPDRAEDQNQKEKDKSKDDKAKAKLKAGRDARARKDGKKHKDGHHKDGKSARSGKDGPHSAGKDPARDERELVVVLPKAVRRALGDAAVEHGTTPERLVALVLSEWLDH
jgi:predicted metal-dependent peptidase